jgi:hypothetical protein
MGFGIGVLIDPRTAGKALGPVGCLLSPFLLFFVFVLPISSIAAAWGDGVSSGVVVTLFWLLVVSPLIWWTWRRRQNRLVEEHRLAERQRALELAQVRRAERRLARRSMSVAEKVDASAAAIEHRAGALGHRAAEAGGSAGGMLKRTSASLRTWPDRHRDRQADRDARDRELIRRYRREDDE